MKILTLFVQNPGSTYVMFCPIPEAGEKERESDRKLLLALCSKVNFFLLLAHSSLLDIVCLSVCLSTPRLESSNSLSARKKKDRRRRRKGIQTDRQTGIERRDVFSADLFHIFFKYYIKMTWTLFDGGLVPNNNKMR